MKRVSLSVDNNRPTLLSLLVSLDIALSEKILYQGQDGEKESWVSAGVRILNRGF